MPEDPIVPPYDSLKCPRCGEPTFGYADPEAPEYADDVCLSCDRYMTSDPTMGLGNA